MQNRQIILGKLPQGKLTVDCFQTRETPMPIPGPGEVLLRTLYVPLDAASRAWMQGVTYRSGLQPGDIMAATTLAEVVTSRSPLLAAGDIVLAETGWQTFTALPAAEALKQPDIVPHTHLLSVYGVPGLTAYFGLLECGRPKAGETVVISAAAGAVGMFAGQIARLHGCHTVGIAGGAAKTALLTDRLGFDAAIDYKAGNLHDGLRRSCPNGIDVLFDNVGGDILAACLPHMAKQGRIVCCGAVSQYDTASPPAAPAGIPGLLIVNSLTMRGFLLADFLHRQEQALTALTAWVAEEKLAVIEDLIAGFELLPAALVGLLAGENTGKRIVQVT
ncbi:NADP-dependent oxidoreductase [Serratia marcescens]|uniref:NADP-dependent oxidoreductase n=1 Tax=Serratia marcescens TaxID=615 RepID=UPI0007455AC5|nr:NADP-dependent oxidoreductase [Serratia marcescens]MBH3209204.1 NADP-dependent oxidoreductase [Serratia marcescens]NCI52954.1 NADP-dependent oxidoreductase [Serratia marcescens]NDJ06811.1 NADP-dependent oxidoreductase [Serratia marcescens]NDJ28322.1 NADP-dependent oxidoreductase [Serratia marcescens]NDJ44135.1 NADP-dependent oxidoreductase [Serratia marcescens]